MPLHVALRMPPIELCMYEPGTTVMREDGTLIILSKYSTIFYELVTKLHTSMKIIDIET